MDRLTRTLAGCGLGLLMIAPGCKSVPEVPPGRKFGTPPSAPIGAELPGVDFGNDPRPNRSPGFPEGAPGSNPRMGGGGVVPAGMGPYDTPAPAPAAPKAYDPGAFPGGVDPNPMGGRPFAMGQPGDR